MTGTPYNKRRNLDNKAFQGITPSSFQKSNSKSNYFDDGLDTPKDCTFADLDDIEVVDIKHKKAKVCIEQEELSNESHNSFFD